jgi:hypothetical protein
MAPIAVQAQLADREGDLPSMTATFQALGHIDRALMPRIARIGGLGLMQPLDPSARGTRAGIDTA